MEESVRRLLAGAVDYAGLFPPAALDARAAVACYARARSGPHAWLLGRFVVPAARLRELGQAMAAAGHGVDGPWPVSVLIGEDAQADAMRVAEAPAAVRVEAVEARAATPHLVRELAARFAAVPERWFEVAPGPDLARLIGAIREMRAGAKLRTGGVQAEQFPSAQTVAGFTLACLRSGVPFKATAGLHHAWCGDYRLTYAADSPSARMFGFLNLLLAVAVGRRLVQGGAADDQVMGALTAILEDAGGPHVRWEADAVVWGSHHVDLDALAAARRAIRGFGSCSFDEPAAELAALGLLRP